MYPVLCEQRYSGNNYMRKWGRTKKVHTTRVQGRRWHFRFLCPSGSVPVRGPGEDALYRAALAPAPWMWLFSVSLTLGHASVNQAQSATVQTWENYSSHFHHSLVEHMPLLLGNGLYPRQFTWVCICTPCSKALTFSSQPSSSKANPVIFFLHLSLSTLWASAWDSIWRGVNSAQLKTCCLGSKWTPWPRRGEFCFYL